MTPDPGRVDREDGDNHREKVNPTGSHQAHSVETAVVEDRGQWAVEIIVLFDDEVVRERIAVHRTERLARISADLIKRTAERDIGGPIHG
jgi:hypothetical protein